MSLNGHDNLDSNTMIRNITMNSLEPDESYTLWLTSKFHNEQKRIRMKSKTNYVSRLHKVLSSELNSRNKFTAMNTFCVLD